MFKAVERNARAFGLLLLVLLPCPACRHVPGVDVPNIKEGPHDPSTYPYNNVESVPIIMVGQILENELVGPPRELRIYPYHIQLYRVKVAVAQMRGGTRPGRRCIFTTSPRLVLLEGRRD